jgi:two-component system, sensor histidine kinase and response regulator
MGASGSAHRPNVPRGAVPPGAVPSDAVPPDAVLRAIVETSDDAIFTCDLEGDITSWGGTAQRLTGRAAPEVVGRPLQSLFPEHLHDAVRAIVARALAGERIQHFETELVRSDGMPVALWLSLCPILGAVGTADAAVVIVRDVTEQHLAQATLAEIESRLSGAEALAHVGSWLWDVRTGAVQWSREFHRIHGVDPLDFDGTLESHVGMIHPDDRDGVRAAMQSSVASGRPFDHQYRIVRSDHQVRTVQIRAQPSLDSGGTAVGLRGVGQDVTEGVAPPDPGRAPRDDSVNSVPPGA